MNHVRTLLLWLLLAALPLQGYAAAGAFMAVANAAAPASQQHAAATDPSAVPGHCAMLAQSRHGDAGADASKARCCHGASCCMGAAIAVPCPALALADMRPAGSEAIPYRLRHVTAHIPSGPERPPHSHSA